MKLIEQGKQALAYYFEVLARAEPDKQIIFVLNLQGSGLAQRIRDGSYYESYYVTAIDRQ